MDNETLWRMFPYSYEDIKAAERYDAFTQRLGNRATLKAARRLVCIGNPKPPEWFERFLTGEGEP